MTRILVTGMSGTGKSSALAELARRGHVVVDTDYDDWSEEILSPDGTHHQLWREDRIARLLDAQDAVIVSGCVSNQGRFYDRFDSVVLLSAPVDLMLERLASRSTNPFGRTAEDRARVLRDLAETEPLLRTTSTIEIVTTVPVASVADAIEGLL